MGKFSEWREKRKLEKQQKKIEKLKYNMDFKIILPSGTAFFEEFDHQIRVQVGTSDLSFLEGNREDVIKRLQGASLQALSAALVEVGYKVERYR